ncbi:6-carboxytetrahydropterin synthase [Granulicella cerasi]|uniref:6-carboxy-5,6,7,8-tetrahydropterin synthase n=1 Tax=Granulicella cerasi TaxID=741063 RepID=A0ABW1ZCB7_9BACT|nr:6-carboxytetrahydropterin synthase [Granulicella cerasi]
MSARPIAHLSRRWSFVAAHRLHVDSLPAEQNREIFGKCNNPYGHGHNYIVQATFSGPVDEATGMVTNLADLDAFAKAELLERYDHQNLNTIKPFLTLVPTTENLAVEVWRIFSAYPHAKLTRIHVEETGNNAFDYFGEGEKEVS